jgi:hypothetical protein
MKRNMALLWVFACALLLSGCTSAPIFSVTNAPILVAAGKQPTMDGVRDAIIRAGARLGWQMIPGETGIVTARLSLRTHVAVVDVRYDQKSYTIVYRESTNLDYSDGHIHKNYNGWIQNLDREIRNELLLA